MRLESGVIDRTESPLARGLLSFVVFFENALGSVKAWCALCLIWAGVLAWANRHAMNPDALSFLDLASGALSGGPAQLVNGYWSPGYPALISVALLIFRPSPSLEFPLVHFVNFLVFAAVLWSFTFFVRNWLATRHVNDVSKPEESKYIIAFAFGLFLWFAMEFIGVGVVTPDLCVSGIVFLIAGIAFRLSLPTSAWKNYFVLGCVLGLGYYAKAAMLLIGLAFLGIFFVWPPSPNVRRPRLLLSGLVCLLIAAPLMALVSSRLGHPSFGDSGRLNYLWYANHRELLSGNSWNGTFGGTYRMLIHPPRTAIERPLTFEFATPLPGTYPLWYDPSYWWAGEITRFNLRQQLSILNDSLVVYKDAFLRMSGIAAGAVVMFVLAVYHRTLPNPKHKFWQLAWPVGACLMYTLVHVEDRYVGAFLLFFWLAIYDLLMFTVDVRARTTILALVLCTVMISSTTRLFASSALIAEDAIRPRQSDYEAVAHDLHALGVHSGDRLAVVGYGFDCYYARLARVRVVAQIPDADEFWHLSTADLNRVKEHLAAIGIRAIVARNRPLNSVPANWRDVSVKESTHFSILLL